MSLSDHQLDEKYREGCGALNIPKLGFGNHFSGLRAVAEAAVKDAGAIVADSCPNCIKGTVCRMMACGRLNLPVDHPARTYDPTKRQQASAAMPVGMVLVPVEPTEKMHNAGVNACDNDWIDDTRTINAKVYRAMLAASQPEVKL